jgi:hypothetical protein
MPSCDPTIKLSVVLTVVSGKQSLRRCLDALLPQVNFDEAEIIVPFDLFSREIEDLSAEFPGVRFHFIESLGTAADKRIAAHRHRLYDRRRAVGLSLARGQIIAMTEDHAVPADDWCEKVLELHEHPLEVIGGAIENGVDLPLNRALYYCDFGRYGRPLRNGDAEYASDVNISYKKDALFSVGEIWREAYHETTVHWALRSKKIKLVLDDRLLVYQYRPQMKLFEALGERTEWGRIFAETRANETTFVRRLAFVAGSIFLPVLLTARVVKNMRRQKTSWRDALSILPLVFLLQIGWSAGEFAGYLNPKTKKKNFGLSRQSAILPD